MRRLACWCGWHVPGLWVIARVEIPWTRCQHCDALLMQDCDGGYFER